MIMLSQYCDLKRQEILKIFGLPRVLAYSVCITAFILPLVAVPGNAVVIWALWKASSIPITLKALFLSLALSDLFVGLIVQPMLGGTIGAMLTVEESFDGSFDFMCPTVVTFLVFFLLTFSYASFLSITAIAFDRLLAITLHLRYQELITLKRVSFAIVLLWTISGLGGFVYISLLRYNAMVTFFLEMNGVVLTTIGYFKIYRVVRRHQIQVCSLSQIQNSEAVSMARHKKSALNTFYMYVVFLCCYFPHLCSVFLLTALDSENVSLLVFYYFTTLTVLLNSSLNPFIYCWRYRELREIVKRIATKIFKPCLK